MTINDITKPVVFLMGPTASGKTALAMDLYQQKAINSSTIQPIQQALPSYEIISVDSAMIYKQMNIGSAKPSAEELGLAPHHLIDFLDPTQSYSASEFCDDAVNLINKIHSRGKTPLLTGGTMLYFKALKDGLADLPATDLAIREQVKVKLKVDGLESLHQELKGYDAVTAARLHINDTQRVTRAVEVYRMTGKPLSKWHEEQQKNALKNPLLSIALAPSERSILHKRIALRFETMLEQGFITEITSLYQRGDLNLDHPSMRCVGYRQFWQYLSGELSYEEAKERAIIATRQLAKRQLTWLRSWPKIQTFDPTNSHEKEHCQLIINHFVLTENS